MTGNDVLTGKIIMRAIYRLHLRASGTETVAKGVCPNGNRILVDAGDSKMIPGGALDQEQIMALRKYLIDNLSTPDRLEYLVITHGDSDHFRLLDTPISAPRVWRDAASRSDSQFYVDAPGTHRNARAHVTKRRSP